MRDNLIISSLGSLLSNSDTLSHGEDRTRPNSGNDEIEIMTLRNHVNFKQNNIKRPHKKLNIEPIKYEQEINMDDNIISMLENNLYKSHHLDNEEFKVSVIFHI